MTSRVIAVQGKVRDTYVVGDKLVIVTTDRQSAFDRLLASIPFKVAVSANLRKAPSTYEGADAFTEKAVGCPRQQQAMEWTRVAWPVGCVREWYIFAQRGQHAGY